MTRQYFFPSGIFLNEPGQQPFRIRYRAKAGDGVRIVINGVAFEDKFKNGKSCEVTVSAEKGDQGPMPFDAQENLEYDPYIEFAFSGKCEFGCEMYGDKEGLVVLSDGVVTLNDPDGNFPFTAAQLAEASSLSLLTPCASDDCGPHWPSK